LTLLGRDDGGPVDELDAAASSSGAWPALLTIGGPRPRASRALALVVVAHRAHDLLLDNKLFDL
jgi:hypothetical protein